MHQAIEGKLKINAAASDKYVQQLQEWHKYYLNEIVADEDPQSAFNMLADAKLKVSTQQAECGSKSDKHMIHKEIKGKFEELDRVIFERRKMLVKNLMGGPTITKICPIDFEPQAMWRSTANDFFQGTREWMMERIKGWHSSNWEASGRVFVLVGVGGIGKSALMVHLCKEEEVLTSLFKFLSLICAFPGPCGGVSFFPA